jgi:hypothetical protein
MPKVATKNKLTWNKNGPLAAQLFRDLYFKKYTPIDTPGEDDKFDTNAIYNDPTRPYSGLNKTTFYTHIQTTWERVKTFKSMGTGFGTETFRQLCKLHEAPPPEDRGPVDREEESRDSSFKEEEEDDITLDDAFDDIDIESAIKEIKISGAIKDLPDISPTSRQPSTSRP